MLIVMIVVYHLLYCETFNYYRRWWYWWWFDDDDVTVVIAVILRVMVALILQSWNKFYSRSDHFGRSHKAGLIGIIIAPSTPSLPSLPFPSYSLTCTLTHTYTYNTWKHATTETQTRPHLCTSTVSPTHIDTPINTQIMRVKHDKMKALYVPLLQMKGGICIEDKTSSYSTRLNSQT